MTLEKSSIDLNQVTDIYTKLEELGTATVDKLFNIYDISGEDKAKAITSYVTTMMEISVNAQIQGKLTASTIEVNDKQIEDIASTIKVREEQSSKDLEVKNSQIAKLVEETNLIKEHIKDRTEKRPKELSNLTKQGTLLDKQANKLESDKNYVDNQSTQLSNQVEHNKLIKAMDSIGDTYGTLGAGGLRVTASMWQTYFNLNKQLTKEPPPINPGVS